MRLIEAAAVIASATRARGAQVEVVEYEVAAPDSRMVNTTVYFEGSGEPLTLTIELNAPMPEDDRAVKAVLSRVLNSAAPAPSSAPLH